MNIVGKFVDLSGFATHVEALQFSGWRPSFVVVHNTSSPSLANYAEWRAHPEKHGNWTPEQWLQNLRGYYTGLGWSAGPHAFVTPDGVALFTPFTQRGTHSPAWNAITWGIETVGEFETEPFDNGVRTNLIATLGILHARVGLNPADYKFGVRGIHFHKEDPKTTHKTCPGKHMVKADLVADVVAYMQSAHPGDHVDVPLDVHASPAGNDGVWQTEEIQRALAGLGFYEGQIDGSYGRLTRSAVRAFQHVHGLTEDGLAGTKETLPALEAAMAAKT